MSGLWVMKQLAIPLLAILSFVLISCDEEKCSEDTMCTLEFAMVIVRITYENGEVARLDSTSVSNLETGLSMSAEEMEAYDDKIVYLIAHDNTEGISFKGTEFSFQGWLDDQLVVEDTFLIARDCCHIELLEGNQEITIDTK